MNWIHNNVKRAEENVDAQRAFVRRLSAHTDADQTNAIHTENPFKPFPCEPTEQYGLSLE